MAKRPPPGICVHCLRQFELLTWDHVFPQAWYPETCPTEFEKWKIPSCEPCNAEHGKRENDLLVRLGLCLDPNGSQTSALAAKALRALSPQHARSDKDAAARRAKRRRLMQQAERLSRLGIPYESVYPGFGPGSTSGDEHIAIPVPKRSIDSLTTKIVRGLTYIVDGRLIQEPYQIECYALSEKSATPLRQVLARHGQSYTCGAALIVQRALVPEDGMSSVYSIEIWSKLKAYAIVSDWSRDPVA